MVGHGGSTNGQQSAFQMVPERDFAIAILTNSDAGHQLDRALTGWALETYLGVVDERPEPLAPSPERLAEYAGEYRAANAIITITVEGDRLVAWSVMTEEAKERLREVLGQPEDPPPVTLALLADDAYVVVGGRADGMRGAFVREDGAVRGVNLGGRVAPKVE